MICWPLWRMDRDCWGRITATGELKIRMGYWPSVRPRWLGNGQVLFFVCVFMDHKLAKKERGQYPAILTEQTWSIKDLLYGLVKFCLRVTAGSFEQARWLHLARSGSQSQRAIWFILPAHGTSDKINISYLPSGRSVWEKSVPSASDLTQDQGHSFFPYEPT